MIAVEIKFNVPTLYYLGWAGGKTSTKDYNQWKGEEKRDKIWEAWKDTEKRRERERGREFLNRGEKEQEKNMVSSFSEKWIGWLKCCKVKL